MITREQIRNLLNGIGDETISKSDADQMAADYPYFSIPQLLYLKFTPGAMPDEKRIQQALIYASPHAHLETILGVEGESFADLYPKAPRTDSTMQAIDLFLGTYRKEQKRGNEEESLDRIISGNILAQPAKRRTGQFSHNAGSRARDKSISCRSTENNRSRSREYRTIRLLRKQQRRHFLHGKFSKNLYQTKTI